MATSSASRKVSSLGAVIDEENLGVILFVIPDGVRNPVEHVLDKTFGIVREEENQHLCFIANVGSTKEFQPPLCTASVESGLRYISISTEFPTTKKIRKAARDGKLKP